MKYLAAVLFSVVSISAFAANVTETIAKIEFENNAKCIRTGQSRFNLCTGGLGMVNAGLQTCWYNVKFDCVSNAGDFGLKLRVKEEFNPRSRMRESRVTKVTYYR